MGFSYILVCLLSCVVAQKQEIPQKPNDGWRLIQIENNGPIWMDKETMFSLTDQDLFYIDLTDVWNITGVKQPNFEYPERLSFAPLVNELVSQASAANVESTLNEYSSFHNRNCRSAFGLEAVEWLFDTVTATAQGRPDISVRRIENPQPDIPQFNVVARIEGTSISEDIVILGGHLDSVVRGDPIGGRAPGADDDGSGSMTNLETFRVLVDSGFRPAKPVEIQWYAAEECGLIGSGTIASSYAAAGVSVFSMMQVDMDGYSDKFGGTGRIGLIEDQNTDTALNDFVVLLIDEYLNIGYDRSPLLGGGSDHASFTRNGYQACFPFEADGSQTNRRNPYIHTINDTVDYVDFEYAFEWVKLGLSYIVEASSLP